MAKLVVLIFIIRLFDFTDQTYFQLFFIATIVTVSAYVRHDTPLQHGSNVRTEEHTSFGQRKPVFRSSFGGQSFHGNRGLGTVQRRQLNRNEYSVLDGHKYGAHSGEYFNKESHQRHRRY